MDEKNNNFEFSGFAENDSLEVPEETEIPNIHKRKNPLEEMLGQTGNPGQKQLDGARIEDGKNLRRHDLPVL